MGTRTVEREDSAFVYGLRCFLDGFVELIEAGVDHLSAPAERHKLYKEGINTGGTRYNKPSIFKKSKELK